MFQVKKDETAVASSGLYKHCFRWTRKVDMLVHNLSQLRMEYEGTPFSPYLRASFHFVCFFLCTGIDLVICWCRDVMESRLQEVGIQAVRTIISVNLCYLSLEVA
jgi:hypothetical protein